MGPESENNHIMYEVDVPVTPKKILEALQEITISVDAPEPDNMPMLEPMEVVEFTVQVKMPKHWRCRRRKWFIKLMMSEGITRNYAERLADFTRTLMPYGEAWRKHLSNELGVSL